MTNWQNGICGCFSNCGLCVLGFFCPCVLFGKTAEKMGDGCCYCGFCVMVPIGNIMAWLEVRSKVRHAQGIQGSCCNDVLCLIFCGPLALIQMAAEVEDYSMAKDGSEDISMARY